MNSKNLNDPAPDSHPIRTTDGVSLHNLSEIETAIQNLEKTWKKNEELESSSQGDPVMKNRRHWWNTNTIMTKIDEKMK